MNSNTLSVKRGLCLAGLFIIFFNFFLFVTFRLLSFLGPLFEVEIPMYGGSVPGVLISLVAGAAVCYLLDGFIAVQLKEETADYMQRKHKVPACTFVALFFVTLLLIPLLLKSGLSIIAAGKLAATPMLLFGLYIIYKAISQKKKASGYLQK